MPRNHRRDALAIFRAGLTAADPLEAVSRCSRVRQGRLTVGSCRYRLSDYRRVVVVGAGKASAAMAVAVERQLGSLIEGGLINVKYGHTARLRHIELNECGHPVPDEAGIAGSEKIAEIVRTAGPEDLVICLISGGASALLPSPAPPITLEEKQATTRLLLACGANIHQMNAVRKHLSTLKGGQLARLARPAKVLSLLLSDVVGDDLGVIGSGPTAPDPSTFADALRVLDHYDLRGRVPRSVRERLEGGEAGRIEETPKSVPNACNVVAGSNRLAVDAAEAAARALGYRTVVLSTTIEGETRDVARMHAAIAREIVQSKRPAKPPVCLLSGGETTVTIRGGGKGGRNQEFTLAAAIDIAGLERVTVLSAGTDGTDGPTDAAGAIADGRTVARADKVRLSASRFLAENDSYNFFEKVGGLIRTGPTKTNVMDLRIVLVG